mmetsp:Transcript_43285/g.85067  ORF Transcript_43285/g.85067 Transcript_43285/m.85067 type:complete len:274 (-) Transcript_43285:204-1025(-)
MPIFFTFTCQSLFSSSLQFVSNTRSAVGFVVGLYFLHLAGILEDTTPTIGTFPGGEFVFKSETRDYAASGGVYREIEKILKDSGEECIDPDLGEPTRHWDHTLHSFYLDDPGVLSSNVLPRYAVGALLRPKQKHLKKKILEGGDTNDGESETGRYETVIVPKCKAAVLEFPHNNGLFSLLLFPHKVLSPLMKFARNNTKGNDVEYPLVITKCHKNKNMCTHYAPLKDNKKYFLGRSSTKKYVEDLGGVESPVMETWRKVKGFVGLNGGGDAEL